MQCCACKSKRGAEPASVLPPTQHQIQRGPVEPFCRRWFLKYRTCWSCTATHGHGWGAFASCKPRAQRADNAIEVAQRQPHPGPERRRDARLVEVLERCGPKGHEEAAYLCPGRQEGRA